MNAPILLLNVSVCSTNISNLSSDFIKNPNEILKVGQKVEVKIISIEQENKKIELSLILEDKEVAEEETTEKE